jgi:hypothetical protein
MTRNILEEYIKWGWIGGEPVSTDNLAVCVSQAEDPENEGQKVKGCSNFKYLFSVFNIIDKGDHDLCNKTKKASGSTRTINSFVWYQNIGIITKMKVYCSITVPVTHGAVMEGIVACRSRCYITTAR